MRRQFILSVWIFILSLSSLKAQIAAIDVDKGAEKVEVEDIIIVFKMHFDIGYTDWSESILQKYTTSMMDETLRSVEETGKLPKEDQFVWTLPGWPMKYIMENTSEVYKSGIEKALKDGRFKVHALPFTFETESSDLETLVRGMSYSSQINRKYDQPLVRGAKLTDVPSHSWILPTLLTQAGVKILHIGCNPGSVSPEDVAAVLKEAREKAPNARIRIGQLEDFYDALMKENPSLPVVKGDMPDTWIHGYMSMPKEVKINKAMQRVIYNTETLNSLLKQWDITPEPVEPYVEKAIEQSLLFDEHTFGLAMSHGHQDFWKYGDDFTVSRAQGLYDFIETSWNEKGSRAHRAEQYIIPSLRKDLKKLAQNVAVKGRKVVVYNPLPWKRSGLVSFHMGVYKKNYQVYGLKDELTGKILPVYNDYSHLSFHAEDIPSLGYKTYTLVTSPISEDSRSSRIDEVEAVLENNYFKIEINKENGALLSVWDKQQQKEMVDGKNEYGFGEYIHEKFGQEEINRYNANYVKPGHHGWADQEMGRPENPDLKYEMIKGRLNKIKYLQTSHSVSATAFCQTGAGDDYTLTYTLEDSSPYLEICWGIRNKPAESQPEGGWLAFPFNLSNPSFRLGRTGGVVNPATDFVKNTNHDYFFLNTGIAIIDNQGKGFGLNTPNAPAVSLDRPGLFRFSGEFIPQRPNVFVNLFNNQWGTNFTEWIEGGFSAKVYLWSIDKYSNETSLITPTEETRVPLMATYTEDDGGELPFFSEGITLSEKGILVTAFGPNTDGEGDLLRLWEQAGKKGKCTVTLSGKSYRSAQFCNLRGEPLGDSFPIKNNELSVEMHAYQPVSIILKR